TSGSSQSATVNTGFAGSLVATVLDQFGNVVPGASVTFSAPASGASATFSRVTSLTDASGQVSTGITAGTVSGAYTVTASVDGATPSASFNLTNPPDVAAVITVASGDGQNATVHSAFASSLVATVTDQYGNPVPGVSVTFGVPAGGAGVALGG